MKLLQTLSTLLLVFISCSTFAQKFGFDTVLKEFPDQPTVFCVPNNEQNIDLLQNNDIHVKFSNDQWLFITTTPKWINEHTLNGELTDFYFEYAPPALLADSARGHHFVNQVQSGLAPLESSYTGANVIVGVVDQGLDYTHPDFIDDQGRTRVLRYWDHTMNGPNSPAPYGYGNVWDSTEINLGLCTSNEETSAHGSTVTGMAAGNGFANGQHKGMAPDANIVFVETNFNLPNWTLTIADAVDYIFKVADTLDMPAVVNLSLGAYFGSHDGKDPAGQAIENLLDAKAGRIVVCAAGNSGAQGKYHVRNTVTADTSFTWFLNNPSNVISPNAIFFDLWSDLSEANWDFALGADSPSYSFRGRSNFHGAQSSLGGSPIIDTIWNNGNRIATFEAYTEVVSGNYHLQLLVNNVDSTDYLFRFETTGSGSYDLWSGSWAGFNTIVESIPSPATMPDIVHYVLPDSLQSIVSSWNCSDKVISVGNMRSMIEYEDLDGNQQIDASTAVGDLSPNSSKGPNRQGNTKPDVVAAGDFTFGPAPEWVLLNPAYNLVIDSGGMHVLNGGTSMASPVVAGIAALYLERCRYATYDQFKNDLITSSYSDSYTGAVPNFAFGNGKPNAYDLLQEQTLPLQPVISYVGNTLESTSSAQYQWYVDGSTIPGETSQSITPQAPYGSYEVMIINNDGCSSISNPMQVTAGITLPDETTKLFPNPSEGTFSLSDGHFPEDLLIIDMNGKQADFTKDSDGTYELSNPSNGTYIVNYVYNGLKYQGKLIIRK